MQFTIDSRLRVGALLLAALLTAGVLGAQDTGNANFARYVAVGDSLTAGFMSGGLIDELQRVSYPSLIYRQVNGTLSGFELPLVTAPGLPPLFQLRNLVPLEIQPAAGLGQPANAFLARPYDNLGVPGATVGDAVNTVTDQGGFHDLILRGLGTQLQQALALQPTFATVWLGNNDALAAATSGIVIDDVTLTSLARFEADYRTVVNSLRAAGAELALATIPEVTAIPFVTTVAPVVVDPVTMEPVTIFGQLVPLIGPDGPVVAGRDFVLLSATEELRQGRGIPVQLGGTGQPLSDSAVLNGAEAATITARVAAFNGVIRTVANQTGAALVDVNAIFRDISRDGLDLGGIEYTTGFLTGGLFSFDGVHATPLGYAIIANEFIRAINRTYGANIPRANLREFVFGPLAGLGTGFITGEPTPGFRFGRAADNQLRDALAVPSRQRLRRIKRRLEGGGGNGGGGGGTDTPPGECTLAPGHRDYCKACGPCTFGQGDCDRQGPEECADGLTCAKNVGPEFGFGPKIDVCM